MMGKKAKHLPKKKEATTAKQKPKKPQGVLHSFSVRESEVDLTKFQKAFREGVKKAMPNGRPTPRGGVILPSLQTPEEAQIKPFTHLTIRRQ